MPHICPAVASSGRRRRFQAPGRRRVCRARRTRNCPACGSAIATPAAPASPSSSCMRRRGAAASGNTRFPRSPRPASASSPSTGAASERTTIAPGGVQPGTAADDLHALMNLLHIDRFHLVGTAAGGFVAFDYALSFPQRLRSLVVANSIGGVQDEDYLALGRRIRPPEFSALPADVRELGPSYRAENPDGTRRWMELERSNRAEGTPPPAQTMRNQITFARLRDDQDADAAADRRRGSLCAAAGDAVIREADQRIGVGGRPRGGPFDVLGAAGGLQQRRAGVHPQALGD